MATSRSRAVCARLRLRHVAVVVAIAVLQRLGSGHFQVGAKAARLDVGQVVGVYLLCPQGTVGPAHGGINQRIHCSLPLRIVAYSACISDCSMAFSVEMTFEFAW